VTKLFGVPASTVADLGVGAATANKFEEKGAQASSNTFTGTLAVTIVEVLLNGNLLVSGEKQVAFDKGVEYVRFSGVVSPQTIGAGNVVSSTQVADARLEYRTNSRIDKAELMSQLARFFLSFAPL
jgi:flagellar L-ring protein FlgH